MRLITFMLLLLSSSAVFSQTDSSKTSSRNTSSTTYQEPASKDYFNICGLRFSTFRDCVDGSWRNCCSYFVEPTYVTCTDKGALIWQTMPSIEIAEMNIRDHLADLVKQGRIRSMQMVTCNVLGKKVKAYHVKRTGSDGSLSSDLRMGAIVNGQVVLLELYLSGTLATNKQIPPVFRQIISLSK